MKLKVVVLLHIFLDEVYCVKDWISENIRTPRNGISSSWIKWKFLYFVSMTKINLINTDNYSAPFFYREKLF